MVLSSAGCKVPWALRGGCGLCGGLRELGCGCCDSLRRRHGAFFAPHPRCGQPGFAAALCGKTAPWSSRSLPRKHSLRRPGDCFVGEKAQPCFSNFVKQGLVFSRGIGYTASRIKKKSDCFPPVAAGDSETVVFYCTPFTVSVFCSIQARSLSFATNTREAMCRVGKSSRCRS